MRERYPPIEPYATGLLDVGDGHEISWEASGDPAGRPALYLHGGPGGGVSPGARRYFNPEIFNIVMFDQRGCGRSRPLANAPDADLSANTTAHLVADIERLRVRLGVARWTVLGVSWGTTLALAYAQAHPERVEGLVLALVGATSRREVEWITVHMGRLFPAEWARFNAAVPPRLRHLPLVHAYAELLQDPDPAVHGPAADAWCAWEDTHVSLSPGHTPSLQLQSPAFKLGFARLVTHYWRHGAFLEEDQLIRDAGRLNGVPGVLIHGRYDVSGPLETAWRRTQVLRTAELIGPDDSGHGGMGSFPAAIVEALDRLGAAPAAQGADQGAVEST